MKRVTQFASAALVSLSLAGGVASAASSGCSIVDTGANSNNVCVNKTDNEFDVTCKNNVDVVFVNGQNSGSGSVTVTGNTNSGFAVSGNAVNTNSTTGKLDVGCGNAASTTSNGGGGQGGGSTSSSTPAASSSAPAAKSLPKTGSNKAVVLAVGTASFAAVAAVARFGSAAARKLS